MKTSIIKCFLAQASGAFSQERDELLVVERPLCGNVIKRTAFNGKLTGLPEYLIDTALEVNTQGKIAELLISRDARGRVHHHLIPAGA